MFIEIDDDEPDKFNAYHMPALELNEARHNLMLGVMTRPPSDPAFPIRRWTLGEPGACAVQTDPFRAIILGELNEVQCHMLAEFVGDCPGVVGQDEAPRWFVERAQELGVEFDEPTPHRIHELRTAPVYPGAPGKARAMTADDVDLVYEWSTAFNKEALPHEPPVSREHVAERVGKGIRLLWEVDGKPVSMAMSTRGARNGASIAYVYTPPDQRKRGYAGSVTAAVVEAIFAQGKTLAYLYTDLRNPYSNKCYANIGFKPVCEAWHYLRKVKSPAIS